MKQSKNKNLPKKSITRRLNKKSVGKFYKKDCRDVYKILLLLKNKHYGASISRMLKIPQRTVSYKINKMIDSGFIKLSIEDGGKFYDITEKGEKFLKNRHSSIHRQLSRYGGGNSKTRMHRLNVKFDIIKDNPGAIFDTENNLKNWIQKYTRISYPIGVTIQKNPKSIVLMFHTFESTTTRTMSDFMNYVLKGITITYHILKSKYGITIDFMSGEIIDQHIANERPDLKDKIDNNKTTTVNLNRKLSGLFKSKMDAKAWIDFSEGLPDIETNDLQYEEKLIEMPENIDVIRNQLRGYAPRMLAIENTMLYIASSINKLSENMVKLTNLYEKSVNNKNEKKT